MESKTEGFTGINTPEWNEASKNFKEKGVLGVTLKDHLALGSTPDEILVVNPEKTKGELMTDEEILSWLIEGKKFIKENENSANEGMKKYANEYKEEIAKTVNYLKSINRLPSEFQI